MGDGYWELILLLLESRWLISLKIKILFQSIKVYKGNEKKKQLLFIEIVEFRK